jgi:hypothetical protein
VGWLPEAPENSGTSDEVTAADGGVAPKFYKLPFPMFDGERDPLATAMVELLRAVLLWAGHTGEE